MKYFIQVLQLYKVYNIHIGIFQARQHEYQNQEQLNLYLLYPELSAQCCTLNSQVH
jgi:hypothetical protein